MSGIGDVNGRASARALMVMSGPAAGTTIQLSEGGVMLGRDAGPMGSLGGDVQLSRQHASVFDTGGSLIVQDLGSSNGTFVNGRRVTDCALTAGDLIVVGGTTLRVVDVAAPQTPPQPRSWQFEDDATSSAVFPATTAPMAPAHGPTAPDLQSSAQQLARPQAYEPPSAPPELPRAGNDAVVEGEARAIQQRSESYGENSSMTVMSFRVERYDDAGNRQQPVPVQFRALGYDGSLSEGDRVRVFGDWKAGTLHSKRMDNLSTGASVAVKSYRKQLIAFLLVVAVMVAVFASIWVFSSRAFDAQTERSHQQFCEQASQLGNTPPGC